jgi:hypothetical protein
MALSAEQEVDEVARFVDPNRELIVRVAVLIKDPDQKFTPKTWSAQAEQDLKNHQFEINKKEGVEEYKTADGDHWLMVAFRMSDARGNQWLDQEWALSKDDYYIVVHATLPHKTSADVEKGKKLFATLGDSLTRLSWYMPIGARGISSGRYELQHFTQEFCKALESKSVLQVGAYFDEMYPEKTKWNTWYQQAVLGDPKSFDLQAQLGGLIINGDGATASFTLIRKNKDDSKPVKLERNFKLAKKDGQWKIVLSLDKN